MREAVGSVSVFNIVIAFVLLFTGYISLSINYSKAYNVKNEIVNIIRNQGGVCTSEDNNPICSNFSKQIVDYFTDVTYHSSGRCEDGWVGFDRDGTRSSASSRSSAFCVKAIKVSENSELENAVYYQIKLFYQLDLPIFRNLFQFSVTGETARIYDANECKYSNAIYEWC